MDGISDLCSNVEQTIELRSTVRIDPVRPTGKKCIPRQDSLEKQIREMLEWL